MYVPVSTTASPTAIELGQKITDLIGEYRMQRPGVSGEDVRQALRIAGSQTAPGINVMRVMILVALGFLLAGFLAFRAWMR